MLQNILKNLFLRLKKPAYYVSLIAVIGLALLWLIFFRGKSNSLSFVDVKRGTIVQEVTVTGKTKAVSSVNLSFESGGRVVQVLVDVGTRVVAGQTLVVLDQSELEAQLAQAEANLLVQKAKLAELKRGPREEDLITSESRVVSSQAALDIATTDLKDAIDKALVQADDVVSHYSDKYFISPKSFSPQFQVYFYNGNSKVYFDIADYELKLKLSQDRVKVGETLTLWQKEIKTNKDLLSLARNSKNYAIQIREFLDLLAQAVNSFGSSDLSYQATVNGYKADIATARTNINAVIDGLNSAIEKYTNAQTNLIVAQNTYNSEKAGSTKEAIIAGEAQVMQAQGQVDLINSQLSKKVLIAPISGVVTSKKLEVGENVSPGVSVISIIADSNLEIEANVPEVDIGKVAVGNPVRITLDAFPGEEFTGRVTYIDPAETVVDGVVNFKIKVIFDKSDTRLKSGLTANLSIRTLVKNNVLVVPQYVLVENDLGTFVRMSSGGKIKDIPVKVGIRGIDSMVEIISGVKEGDKVVNVGARIK
jgi:RND family efflux transporter MFP subunit